MRNLTIVGADKTTTIIKPGTDTAAENSTGADDGAWILVNSGVTFNLSNVTLDGTGRLISYAILSHGLGTIDNNIITNIRYQQYVGRGIWSDTANMTISNNTLSNIERVGIFFGAGVTHGIASGNTYTGKGNGDWLDYGIEVEWGAHVDILNNTISACGTSSTAWGSAAILVSSYYGPGSTGLISGNTLTGNETGIDIGYINDATPHGTILNNTFGGNGTDIYGAVANNDQVQIGANTYGPNGPIIDGKVTLKYIVGQTATVSTVLSANGVYGMQLVVSYDHTVLTSTGGTTINAGGFYWDYLTWNFDTSNADLVKLAGTMQYPTHSTATDLTNAMLATWTFSCAHAGTSALAYTADTLLSDINGFNIPIPTPIPGTTTNPYLNPLPTIQCVDVGAVNGTINLQGRLASSPTPAGWNGAVVTLTCTDSMTGCDGYGPYTFTATDVDGTFTRSDIVQGTYSATVTRRAYLSATKAGSVMVSGTPNTITSSGNPILLGGDVQTPYGVVDISDLTDVAGVFGNTIVPADTLQDINGDGKVNIFDLVLVGGNYTKTSSSPVVWH